MKTLRRIGRMTVVAAAVGLGLLSPSAYADVYMPKGHSQASIQPIQSAEDAVDNIPVLSRIPRSFLIGDGFKFKLSGTELRIDHMATHSRAPIRRRNCMVSLNIASPVSFFGSSMELPLVSAQNLSTGWGITSLGDYVLHFSKEAAVASPTLGLRLTARF